MSAQGSYNADGRWRARLTPSQLTEEIEFLSDICGLSMEQVAERLGCQVESLQQRARREAKRRVAS